jgi:predicted RNase H-like HicB family nuclease
MLGTAPMTDTAEPPRRLSETFTFQVGKAPGGLWHIESPDIPGIIVSGLDLNEALLQFVVMADGHAEFLAEHGAQKSQERAASWLAARDDRTPKSRQN